MLSVAQQGLSNVSSVEYEMTARDDTGKVGYFAKDLDQDKVFLHPLDSHGFIVDCVTDGNGSRVGRAWPQALPGSAYLLPTEPDAPKNASLRHARWISNPIGRANGRVHLANGGNGRDRVSPGPAHRQ